MEKQMLEKLKQDLKEAIAKKDYAKIAQLREILNITDEQAKYFEQGLTGYASIDIPWSQYYTKDAMAASNKIPVDKTVWDMIEKKLEENYDRTAIEYFKNKISSEEFINNVYTWARTFRAMGVEQDEVVPIYGPFVPDICAMTLALNMIGATPYFLKLAISPEALTEETKDSKIAVVFDGMWKNVAGEFSKSKFKNVIVASAATDMPSPKKEIVSFISYVQAKKDKSLIPDEKKYIWCDKAKDIANYYTGNVKVPFKSNRAAFITSSSGTTVGGVVKGVVATNESTLAQLEMAAASYMKYAEDDTCLTNFPPTASTALNVLFLYALYKGLKIDLDPRVSEKDFYNQIMTLNPSVVLTTGSMWETFFNRVRNEIAKGKKIDLNFAKGWFIGGEGTDLDKYKAWNKIMRELNAQNELFSGYGASELFSAISMEKPNAKTPEDADRLSVGIPYAGLTVGVFDKNGNELPYNSRGELWINSKSAMKEYYNKPELTNKVLVDGWIHTGDIVKVDDKGFIYIYGRYNDTITLKNGEELYLFDISDAIKKYNFIDDAIVLLMPTKENKQNLVAHIVWSSEVKQEEKVGFLKQINSDLSKAYNGLVEIGGYHEYDVMLPYSPTTLKKDKNGMSHKTTGYIQSVNDELVDVSYINQEDNVYEQVIKNNNAKSLKLAKN